MKNMKKVLTLALAGALVFSMSAGAALATDAQDQSLPNETVIVMMGSDESSDAAVNFAVKMEDDVIMYSIDGGETWTTELPEGIIMEYNTEGANDKQSFEIQMDEDGTVKYSVDGGETWSTEVPETYIVTVDDDGNVSVTDESDAE